LQPTQPTKLIIGIVVIIVIYILSLMRVVARTLRIRHVFAIKALVGPRHRLALDAKNVLTNATGSQAACDKIFAHKVSTYAAFDYKWVTQPCGAIVAILVFANIACHYLVPLGNLCANPVWAVLISLRDQ